MIKISNCPGTLREGFHTYSPAIVKTLFDGAKVNPVLNFNFDETDIPEELTNSMHRISVSGVQEKFPAIVKNGEIRIAQDGERSTHILKPAPWDKTLQNRKLIPANEHLTMQIASQIYNIKTAANALCFTPKGKPVYITKRFDILHDGTKLLMEDFASVIGKNELVSGLNFKYNSNYESVAKAIKSHVAAWMVDMERFFELVVFNYIYANGDAHLKNFSLILNAQDYRLAPAYDLINTGLHINGGDFGLDGGLSPTLEKSTIYDRTGHPCRYDFEQFGNSIGLVPSRIKKILNKYILLPESAKKLISQSFLPDKAKRNYIRIVNERINRFARESE